MRILIDTHILLWILQDSPRLSAKARQQLQRASEVYVSAASFWEIAIKQGLGKLNVDIESLRASCEMSGIIELPVTVDHAIERLGLAPLNKDPFDRIIAASAVAEPMKLMTADSKVAAYTNLAILV
ncbi:type II toxin-antitoxin system VapC family toxin [Pseudomonas lopnurensis]|uniref:type II toxin-antitoxin system VapC family toxin n=1 Tax=Pseudomonas lopnurensis TaxID=1477517 RepID=UPI00187AA9D3|nr:type II toxin-antitoxin system VapC family toxin [Pseudomonas lopnurensis]MBE7374357.1 type II toxin-antitoxin system VapC family toxin [Pseudomonas lopnurensis]